MLVICVVFVPCIRTYVEFIIFLAAQTIMCVPYGFTNVRRKHFAGNFSACINKYL